MFDKDISYKKFEKIRNEVLVPTPIELSASVNISGPVLTINNPSVNLEIKGDVAVLTVSRFDKQTAVLARQEAEKIKAQGISKVVLDLRGNSGGYLTAARDLAGLWLDGQLVVSERIGDKTVQEFFSKKGDNILANAKTVILMNAGSASAERYQGSEQVR